MSQFTYKDFLPNKEVASGQKETFSNVIDSANAWLKINGKVKVKTCEMVTWMGKVGRRPPDNEAMVMSRKIADNENTYHLRGLRLWLTADDHANDGNHVKKLSYCDIVPDRSDTICSLIDKINQKMDNSEINGRIVSVQTLWFTLSDNEINTEAVEWIESETFNSCRAFILRVFYIEEDGHNETIGVKDFLPHTTGGGDFEGFGKLVNNANSWLTGETDLTLLNMQSILVQNLKEDTGNECFFTIPHPSESHTAFEFFRILRVFYIITKAKTGVNGDRYCPLAYETFTPQLIQANDRRSSTKHERVEKMQEVFNRAKTFLEQNEYDVINAETVMNPMQNAPESKDSNSSTVQEVQWLFTIRLYLSSKTSYCMLEETPFLRDESRLSSTRSKKENQPKHPGPIFLRNVVNRQYKYRWVIVAVVAFATMSCIVALSVIYANK